MVSDLKTYAHTGCKIAASKKSFFFTDFWFNHSVLTLFPPTSWSWMSKVLRDSESLGKSNAKKGSQIWKLLLIKSVNCNAKKKVLVEFCLSEQDFFGIGVSHYFLRSFAPPFPKTNVRQFFTSLCKMVVIHLKDMNTLHSGNVIPLEGWLPSTWITLHVCNVFTFFKYIICSWKKLHGCKVKYLKHVNNLKFLPFAKNLTGM